MELLNTVKQFNVSRETLNCFLPDESMVMFHVKQSHTELDILKRYVELVLDKNHVLNLTSITDPKEARKLLLEDSLTGEHLLSMAPDGPYADLGTGGGFPGVPLGIVSHRETWLVESRKKKLDAIKELLMMVNRVDQFRFAPLRIEELALEKPEYFSVVTARALTSLPSLLELASPLLRKGGQLLSYQARHDEGMIGRAQQVGDLVGMELVDQDSFTLSDGATPRCLLVYEKTGTPTIQLPRRNGVAQKRPLA